MHYATLRVRLEHLPSVQLDPLLVELLGFGCTRVHCQPYH